ncbi:MAG: hypothetical protein M3T56_04490 [Chloroflexota bacterium]|nr:hypothetical protein [Chloroflexota bacterium]
METTETAHALAVEALQGSLEHEVATTLPAPIAAAKAAPDPATSEVTGDSPNDHGLTALTGALRVRELALIDTTILKESATEIAAAVRALFQDLHLEDIRLGTALAEARALVGRFDLSALTSAIGGAIGAARRPRDTTRVATPASDVSYPSRVKMVRIGRAVTARSMPRARNRFVGRVRWGRVLTRGLSVGVIAAVLVTLPPELTAKVASEVTSTVGSVATEVTATIGNLANEVGSAIGEQLAATQPGATLARASFEVPPLSAYGAAFESQAPYPTVRPNGPVEWVVALRNTGSVGWYRGIDGAQASLALADGTSAGVQTTAYVGPGQVGWFVVHFTAPSQPGVAKIALLPRIDGRGSLPDLGIYATVTVSPNP